MPLPQRLESTDRCRSPNKSPLLESSSQQRRFPQHTQLGPGRTGNRTAPAHKQEPCSRKRSGGRRFGQSSKALLCFPDRPFWTKGSCFIIEHKNPPRMLLCSQLSYRRAQGTLAATHPRSSRPRLPHTRGRYHQPCQITSLSSIPSWDTAGAALQR